MYNNWNDTAQILSNYNFNLDKKKWISKYQCIRKFVLDDFRYMSFIYRNRLFKISYCITTRDNDEYVKTRKRHPKISPNNKVLVDFFSLYVQRCKYHHEPHHPYPLLSCSPRVRHRRCDESIYTLIPPAKHFRNRSAIRKSNSKTTNLV